MWRKSRARVQHPRRPMGQPPDSGPAPFRYSQNLAGPASSSDPTSRPDAPFGELPHVEEPRSRICGTRGSARQEPHRGPRQGALSSACEPVVAHGSTCGSEGNSPLATLNGPRSSPPGAGVPSGPRAERVRTVHRCMSPVPSGRWVSSGNGPIGRAPNQSATIASLGSSGVPPQPPRRPQGQRFGLYGVRIPGSGRRVYLDWSTGGRPRAASRPPTLPVGSSPRRVT